MRALSFHRGHGQAIRRDARASRSGGLLLRCVVAAVLGPVLATALGATAMAAGPSVSVSKAWMRFIIAARPAAGYMTLTNTGSATQVLTGASSPACGMIMLHRSVSKNGAEMMSEMKQVSIAPNASVSFAPGGYHLMCMSPDKDMATEKSVPVKLEFRDGTSVRADFQVRGASGQ